LQEEHQTMTEIHNEIQMQHNPTPRTKSNGFVGFEVWMERTLLLKIYIDAIDTML
jgi:hypothetical protein